MSIFHIYFDSPKHKCKLYKKVDDCLFQAVQEKRWYEFCKIYFKVKGKKIQVDTKYKQC